MNKTLKGILIGIGITVLVGLLAAGVMGKVIFDRMEAQKTQQKSAPR